MSEILHHSLHVKPIDHQTISIDQILAKRVQRRRRVAKRMVKRFPLFAVEFMQEEFPRYDHETFVADVTRKTRKGKSFRRSKSPLIRQGRYPLYEKALSNYRLTNERKYLEEAQHWRSRLHLRFELLFVLNKERKYYSFHSTTALRTIEKLKGIKGYKTWEELDSMIKEATKYDHIS